MQKILVVQTAFIGDVVLATALIEKLHAAYPQAAIDMLVRKGNEQLFSGHPFLREALVWNKKQAKYRNLFAMIGKIRKRKYDLVVNVQRYAATGLITAFSDAARTVGFNKNPFSFLFTDVIPHAFDEGMHETERNHRLIAAFTGEQAAKPRLYPAAADENVVRNYKNMPYICIGPASVWFTKQFPAEQWITFISSLPSDLQVFLLGAPGDLSLCETIAASAGHKNITVLAGKLNFLESAALMRDARMNYVNDSAPMHFASAVNAPVTAVYCSTVPAFGYGPLSDNRHIVETPYALDCRPCGLHGYKACPLEHFNCAKQIGNDQLLATLL